MSDFRPGAITIERIVAYVLDELNKEGEWSEYAEKVATKVIRGIMDLNIYTLSSTSVAYLRVNPDNTVDLPDDYIDYIKIGILYNNRIWTLTVADTIALPREELCGQDIRDALVTTGPDNTVGAGRGYYFPVGAYNGVSMGGMYGLTGGFNVAYYRIDRERNQIVLDGRIPKCIVALEYQSAGIGLGTNTLIPAQAVECLVAFGVWRMKEGDSTISQSEKERAKNQYMEQLEKLRFFESACTIDEWKDAIYSSATLAPKR